MAPNWLKNFDWANEYDADTLSQDTIDRVETCIEGFLLTRTKQEIYKEGWDRGIMIAPVKTMEDIASDEQLIARGFWQKIEHPELETSVTYCGPFVKMSETPLTSRRRPPLIGEHNLEIYAEEMQIPKETLAILKSSGAI
jgi:crotonobetainyl-CoA:carnitine CoA-transferase CaiB-like acyl-CoA transferase